MRKFFQSTISIYISIGFFLTLFTIIIVQYLTDDSIDKLKLSQQQMLKSSMLVNKVSQVESSVCAYDGRISDFIYTGNTDFLKNNESTVNLINENMIFLKNQDLNADQKTMLVQLDSLVKAELLSAQKSLGEYYKLDKKNDSKKINTGPDERILDEISAVSSSFQKQESSNLSQIIERNNRHTKRVDMTNDFATAFTILVVFVSILVLFRDIKRRNKVEKELRFAEKQAYKVAEMKEQFMANMSHEIRTPMNAILGFAGLLNHTKLDSKQQEYISSIQTSGENLLTIINDILDFSKIEAGMLRIEKVSFSPSELLHSLQIMFQQKAYDKNLSLNFNIDSTIPPTVTGDPTRLTQVLINLINNAIKFTSQGGVSVTAKKYSENEDEVLLEIQVKDSGIGIPTDKLNTVFERFNQAETDTTRKFGGSGLGLSIVKKLVELQNGEITLESNVGIGTVFTFKIPYEKNQSGNREIAIKREEKPIERGSSASVLVVEDNIMNQKLAQSLLEHWGFDYVIVPNGRVALEKLRANQFNLILMDIQMPEMNGYDTASTIRHSLKLDTPIIAMTAHALPGEKEKCISLGMNDYISKPIREKELLQLINKYLQQKNSETPVTEKNNVDDRLTGKVTNLNYLYELANGKPEFVQQMVELFLSEAPHEIDKLEYAVYQENDQEIYAIAHKFKSTASFVGIESVKNDLLTIEKLATEKVNHVEISRCFSNVKAICTIAILELKSALSDFKKTK